MDSVLRAAMLTKFLFLTKLLGEEKEMAKRRNQMLEKINLLG